MSQYLIKQVDSFTSQRFKGNPAGVVLDAKEMSEETMQAVAREMNCAETAFVLPATRKDADLRIRWFTPEEEVPLCGHATIGAFHSLAEEGMVGMKVNGQHYFRLETRSGILPVKVEKNFHGITVEFDLPVPAFRKKRTLPAGLLKALDISTRDLHAKLPSVQDLYLYIPVKGLSVLRRMSPNFQSLIPFCDRFKTIGVCVFCLETVEPASGVHSRFFAPSAGIGEDPVTGSANGPLGAYLETIAIPAGERVAFRELPDGRREFIGEQGDEIGRKGRVQIRVQRKNGSVQRVSIAGEAVTVFTSSITL